jgi:hypothetical protein
MAENIERTVQKAVEDSLAPDLFNALMAALGQMNGSKTTD